MKLKRYIIWVGIIICIISCIYIKFVDKCEVEGCFEEKYEGSDYCLEHKCIDANCANRRNGKNYCSKHKKSSYRLGSLYESTVPKGNYKKTSSTSKNNSTSRYSSTSKYSKPKTSSKKYKMPDCDDYDSYDDFMDDWEGKMPDGSDAEDYWDNW